MHNCRFKALQQWQLFSDLAVKNSFSMEFVYTQDFKGPWETAICLFYFLLAFCNRFIELISFCGPIKQ